MSDHHLDQHKKRSSTRSGEHRAVKVYREKLDSVAEKGAKAVDELDRELQEFLDDLRTPVPENAPPALKGTAEEEAAARLLGEQ